MEESVEESILPIIIVAIFLLLIIGIIVWVVMSRRIVGPAPIPVPLAPLVPPASSGNTPNVPSSVPVVRATSQSRTEETERDRDACDGSRSGSDSSSSTSTVTSSISTAASSRDDADGRCISVYSYSLDLEDTLDLPDQEVISIAYSSGDLYSCTSGSIYVRDDDNWALIGSVDESIIEMFDDGGRLRVRTDSGDYLLRRTGDQAKMSRCRTKKRMHQDEEILLKDSTLYLGNTKMGRGVDCFCVDGDELLAYTDAEKLHVIVDGDRRSKRTNCRAHSACMSNEHIYLLSSRNADSYVSGSGSE